MITINGIEITDYSAVTGATNIITVATKHDAALSGIDINDTVTVADGSGSLTLAGSYEYTADDSFGQKCFTEV